MALGVMYISEKDVEISRMHGFKRGVHLFAESREDSHFKVKLSKGMRFKRPKKAPAARFSDVQLKVFVMSSLAP